jgi:GrpB-like predicted nucleotidyltransferase (UPF0157 family)
LRKVIVAPYDERWVFLFDEEAATLRAILGGQLVEAHHFGSTAVPGMVAKPIIDILLVVRDISLIDTSNSDLEAFGYEAKGENGIPGRRFFQKGGDHRTHHLHIYQAGSPEIERHLAFRDYLRTHAAVREEYSELKKRLSQQFPLDIESYINGKEELASRIQKAALDWYRQ